MEDGDDPDDPHGDGFGDDLMGDDDDREKLESLTEFQREAGGVLRTSRRPMLNLLLLLRVSA